MEIPDITMHLRNQDISLQKTSLFLTLYFQGSPKKVQTDAENRRERICMATFISRFIKTLEISQYNRLKKMRTTFIFQHSRESFGSKILHFSAPLSRDPQNKDIPKFSINEIKPII